VSKPTERTPERRNSKAESSAASETPGQRAWNIFNEYVLKLLILTTIAGVIAGWILLKGQREEANRKEVEHLWDTLVDANELSDSSHLGAGPDLNVALTNISNIEKNLHLETWKEYVPGTESDFQRFLNRISLIVKKTHRTNYDIVALRVESNRVLAKGKTTAIWPANELPAGLSVLAFDLSRQASIKNDGPASAIPFALVSGWHLVANEKWKHSSPLVLSLSNPEVRNRLAALGPNQVSELTRQMNADDPGLLVPTFIGAKDYQSCFKFLRGLIEADDISERCKPYAQQLSAVMKTIGSKNNPDGGCYAPLLRLRSSPIDIDPCRKRPGVYADLSCQRSVEAFLRKKELDPKRDETTHLEYILENCGEELKHLLTPKEIELLSPAALNKKK
jgi:hypothetical protein